MARIDIHGFDRRLTRELELLEELDVPQETKELIKEFIDDGLQGWGTTKISKARAAKLLMHLRFITELLCKNSCGYEYMTEKDLKKLLKEIDKHYYEVKLKKGKDPEKMSWGQTDTRTTLLKFMKWLRSEKGYPDDYPDKKVAESAKGRFPSRFEGCKGEAVQGRPGRVREEKGSRLRFIELPAL